MGNLYLASYSSCVSPVAFPGLNTPAGVSFPLEIVPDEIEELELESSLKIFFYSPARKNFTKFSKYFFCFFLYRQGLIGLIGNHWRAQKVKNSLQIRSLWL